MGSGSRISKRHSLPLQFNPQVIAGRVGQVLPHTEIPFGGLDRLVAKGQLDLPDRNLSLVDELRKGATDVVGREFEPESPRSVGDDEVDGLRRECLADDASGPLRLEALLTGIA